MLRPGIVSYAALGPASGAGGLGSEEFPQPLFAAATGLTLDANWSIGSNVATGNGGTGFMKATVDPLTIGLTYHAEIVVATYSAGMVWTPYDGTGSGQATIAVNAGTFTKEFVAASTELYIYGDGFVGTLSLASCKEVP